MKKLIGLLAVSLLFSAAAWAQKGEKGGQRKSEAAKEIFRSMGLRR